MEPPRYVASTRILKVLAALIWYSGGVVLLLKGGSLLLEAEALKPGASWPWLAAAAGFVLGGLQAGLVFNKSCQRNLDRIASLEQPKIWQFYRPGFFAALAAMILAGATLSRLAHSNVAFLLGVATLDLSIAVALLGSSYVFWKRGAAAP